MSFPDGFLGLPISNDQVLSNITLLDIRSLQVLPWCRHIARLSVAGALRLKQRFVQENICSMPSLVKLLLDCVLTILRRPLAEWTAVYRFLE